MNQLLDPRPVDPRPVEPRPAVLPSRKKPRKRNESRSVIGFMYIVFWYCLAFFSPGEFSYNVLCLHDIDAFVGVGCNCFVYKSCRHMFF